MTAKTATKKACSEQPVDKAFLKVTMKDVPVLVALAFIVLLVLKIILSSKKRTRKGNSLPVFITGCDSGIGYESAKRLDKLGFKVFAGCHFPDGDGAKRLKSCTSDKLTVVGIDVTKDEDVRTAAEFVRKNLSPVEDGLYCLVNNAGAKIYGDFDWYTTNQCEHQVNVTLLGTIRVTKHFLPLLKAAKGRIVTFTGINGRVAFPQLSVYSATKFALEGFCGSLRYEMIDAGVSVTIIQPGDLSLSLGLLQSYRANAEDMWASMAAEDRVANKDSFDRWKSQVKAASLKKKSAHKDTFRLLLNDLEEAVLSRQPQMRYVSAPFPYRHLYTILRVVPESWRISLIQSHMRREQARLTKMVEAAKNQEQDFSFVGRQRSATASW